MKKKGGRSRRFQKLPSHWLRPRFPTHRCNLTETCRRGSWAEERREEVPRGRRSEALLNLRRLCAALTFDKDF